MTYIPAACQLSRRELTPLLLDPPPAGGGRDYRTAGNFRVVQFFVIFATTTTDTKIITAKLSLVNFGTC